MLCLRPDEYENSRCFHSYLDFKKAKDFKDRRLIIYLPRYTVEISQCPNFSIGYLMYIRIVANGSSFCYDVSEHVHESRFNAMVMRKVSMTPKVEVISELLIKA